MKKNKGKGFTLVELLAVIVILAVILVIAIPQITKVIKQTRVNAMASTAKLICSKAEEKEVENEALEVSESMTCSDLVKLDDNYDSANCTIEKNAQDKWEVSISGASGKKFEGITCTGTKDNMTCTDGSSNNSSNNNQQEVVCAENEYKDGNNCEACPVGTTSPAGSTSVSACAEPTGNYVVTSTEMRLGQLIPQGVNVRTTPSEAINDWKAITGDDTTSPIYLKLIKETKWYPTREVYNLSVPAQNNVWCIIGDDFNSCSEDKDGYGFTSEALCNDMIQNDDYYQGMTCELSSIQAVVLPFGAQSLEECGQMIESGTEYGISLVGASCVQGTQISTNYYNDENSCRNDLNYYTSCIERETGSNIIGSIYVEFIVTDEMAQANPGMTAGRYSLRGGVGEGGVETTPIYNANKATLLSAFGSENCYGYSTSYSCGIANFSVGVVYNGTVNYGSAGSGFIKAIDDYTGYGYNCYVNYDGSSKCHRQYYCNNCAD